MSDSNGCWPIIYVRGYAMSRGEIDETTADPFCGFNIGSTVIRATPDPKAPPRKLIFESPLVRLQSDFQYGDVYENGVDIDDADFTGTIRTRSVIIYRYYDSASTLFGTGKTPDIESFAKGLSKRMQEAGEERDVRLHRARGDGNRFEQVRPHKPSSAQP